MDNKEIGAFGSGSAVKLDTSFGHEGGGDFSLPDYLPEIQRLLAVRVSVLPETKFLSGNVLEAGGTLSYDVIYSDVDGKMASASLVTDYSADTALSQNIENVGELFITTEAENSTCRVTSPRGLNIKTRMRTRVCADEPVITDAAFARRDGKRASDAESLSVERLTYPATSASRSRAMTTGNITGEISAKENDRVMTCRAALSVNDAAAADGAVRVSGEVYLCCIFDGENGLSVKNAKYPFDATVPVSGCEPSCNARAWGRAASVSVTPAEAGGGAFSVNVEYDIEAECICKVEMNVCSDVYSTEYECSGEMRECELVSPSLFGMAKAGIGAVCDLPSEDKGELIDVVPIMSSVQFVSTPEGSSISGSVKIKALFAGDEVSACEFDIPVKYMLDKPIDPEVQSFINCSVLSLSGKVSSGKLDVTGEVSLSWNVSCKKKVRYVTSVSLGEECEGVSPLTLKVYYPHSDESLWSVCKKYRADMSRVIRANPDIGDTVIKGTPIIIC